MVILLKTAAVAGALALSGTTAADVCTCKPPETEAISCLSGVASFAKATCTDAPGTPSPSLTTEVLACPPGETAISAGFRHVTGPYRPLLEMTPVVPTGGHPVSFRFIWRSKGGTELRVYIVCQRD